MDRDAACIRRTHGTCIGLASARKHIDKRLILITIFIDPLKIDRLRNTRIQRSAYPSNHGHQMRYEGQPDARARRGIEPLQDLRPVTVARDPIGLEVVRGLGKKEVLFSPLARAAHP